MQELTKSVEFLSANIDTANQTLKKVQLDYAEIMKQNQKLNEANLKLGDAVNELKSKVRELEQYSRRTNLEISGIPETRNEDTMKILRDIGTAIGVELHDTQVMAAHRVPSYKQGRAPPMVVQFQTKMQRDVWIANYKKNRDLSARRVNTPFRTPGCTSMNICHRTTRSSWLNSRKEASSAMSSMSGLRMASSISGGMMGRNASKSLALMKWKNTAKIVI
ncbi:hypothetical protein J6590_106545, partial [Homalodisca vitripennis]